jgi:hypothetical protein
MGIDMTPRELEVLKQRAHDIYLDPHGGIDEAIDFLVEELTGNRDEEKEDNRSFSEMTEPVRPLR